MALTHFTRPALPYDNAPLPNDKRFQTITQTLRKPITDGLLDAEFNSITDNLNVLDQKIEEVVAGNIPGSDVADNAYKFVTTDGASRLSFMYVTNANVEDDSISGTKIANGTIGTAQLDDGIITPVKIPNDSIPYGKMNFNNGDIPYAKLNVADGEIPYAKLNVADGEIPGNKIVNQSISTNKMQLYAIGSAQIANSSVILAKLGQDVFDLINSIRASIPPIGSIIPMGMVFPGPNFIVADGRLLNRATYPDLFRAYGTTYGAGDGATTFGIPDWRGLTMVGIGADNSTNGRVTNATAPNIALGQTFGNETHTLTVDEMPSHNHQLYVYQSGGSVAALPPSGYNFTPSSTTLNTGGGQPHNNMQPGMFCIFYVRVL